MTTERRVRRDIHGNLGTPVEAEWGYCQTHKHGIFGDGSRAGGIPHASMFNVQEQTFLAADAGGTANAITIGITNFNPTAYVKYQRFVFLAASTNTGNTTANVASLGNKTVKKIGPAGTKVALVGGEIVAAGIYSLTYDGTDLILGAPFQHATETIIGAAEIATQAEVDAGTDDTRIVTPLKLAATAITKFEVIDSGTESAVASVDFVGLTSVYRALMLVVNGVLPATDGQDFSIRTSDDNGSTFDSGAGAYLGMRQTVASDGTHAASGASATLLVLAETQGNVAETEALAGRVVVYNPTDLSERTKVDFNGIYGDSAGNPKHVVGGGRRQVAEANDAFQALYGSGNIATMNWTLYGLRAS